MQATEWKPNRSFFLSFHLPCFQRTNPSPSRLPTKTERPIAIIRQLGELLSVETNEEVENVEFDFSSDLNSPQFLDLRSELSPLAESTSEEIEVEEGEEATVEEAEVVVEEVEVVEVVEVEVEEVVEFEEMEDASSASKL